MVAPFLHYEVLGPRAGLDDWLASLQDVGVCHLADALRDLEGEAGIGRPAPTTEEVHAQLIRSEATRALLGVRRVLPATPTGEHGAGRPSWTIGPGAVEERAVHQLKDEARSIATTIHEALDAVRRAEEDVTLHDALHAAFTLLCTEAAGPASARVYALPASRRAMRRLHRRIERAGARVLRGAGLRTTVVVVMGEPGQDEAAAIAAASGARSLPVPADLRSLSPIDACARLDDERARALRAEGDARAALTARVREHGARGRLLLDSLEDAERRAAARQALAATEHVVAARVYVRPEDEPRVRDRLRQRHGDVVVLRPLAEAGDAPSLPRQVASVPFAALRGLTPAGFSSASLTAVLALLTPLAVGIAWSDVGGGLLLLLAGAVLQGAAGPGSPRRDTALLAQLGGLVALALGVARGAAFGPAGEAWFGGTWGLLADFPAIAGDLARPLRPFAAVLGVLGAFALLVAAWGGVLALLSLRRGHAARARADLLAGLHFLVVAGLGAAALGAGSALHVAWLLAPAAALGVLLLAGGRGFLVRLCLDLVGVLRLVAVAGGALLVFDLVLAGWAAPGLLDLTLGSLAVLVAALAVVADPAHLAMGVPYDLALGGREVGRPFEPFRRRTRTAGEA